MTDEEYESMVRPALARFCGWRYVFNEICPYWETPDKKWHYAGPADPLRNPADAWALMESLLSKRPTLHLNASTVADWFSVYSLSPPSVEREGRGNSLRLALVLAAWSVVRETEDTEG